MRIQKLIQFSRFYGKKLNFSLFNNESPKQCFEHQKQDLMHSVSQLIEVHGTLYFANGWNQTEFVVFILCLISNLTSVEVDFRFEVLDQNFEFRIANYFLLRLNIKIIQRRGKPTTSHIHQYWSW